MLELLFVVALLSWAAINVLLYLASLPAAYTLLAGALAVPVLTWVLARWLVRWHGLDFLRSARRPVPPERFYWPGARRRLGIGTVAAGLLALASWPVALVWPAGNIIDAPSLTGWIAGALAIFATARLLAGLRIYIKASQRFDHLAPGLVGWLRQGLYRLSDNHEFLGEEPLPREKRVRESVY